MVRRAFRVVALCLPVVAGCAPLDLGSFDSFDAWYAGQDGALQPDDLGVRSLDGGFPGYVVNDLAIRTPAMLGHDLMWVAMIPVALPYYGVAGLVGGGEGRDGRGAGPAEAPEASTAPEGPTASEASIPAGPTAAPEASGAPAGAKEQDAQEATP